ncbi:hypothetical protein GWK47_020093 [Chionoecetes opilio]|uniref:Uncharacterized protein n=1 Tax=Chionoecetes opilio TaxID=41210 RepID=A0A8J4XTK1_CHIOP|nr:hypothetical protein GWK47_020093 [Chionoecetes opilio]
MRRTFGWGYQSSEAGRVSAGVRGGAQTPHNVKEPAKGLPKPPLLLSPFGEIFGPGPGPVPPFICSTRFSGPGVENVWADALSRFRGSGGGVANFARSALRVSVGGGALRRWTSSRPAALPNYRPF